MNQDVNFFISFFEKSKGTRRHNHAYTDIHKGRRSIPPRCDGHLLMHVELQIFSRTRFEQNTFFAFVTPYFTAENRCFHFDSTPSSCLLAGYRPQDIQSRIRAERNHSTASFVHLTISCHIFTTLSTPSTKTSEREKEKKRTTLRETRETVVSQCTIS